MSDVLLILWTASSDCDQVVLLLLLMPLLLVVVAMVLSVLPLFSYYASTTLPCYCCFGLNAKGGKEVWMCVGPDHR